MNTIGKILVILNLIFALVVGGFLVIDFATRTNWKVAYDKMKNEMEIARLNTDVSGRTMRDLSNIGKQDKAESEVLKVKLVDQEKIAKAKEDMLLGQIDEANDKAKQAELKKQEYLTEKEKLKEEVKGLAATVQERENVILALQAETKKSRNEAVAQENTAKAMQSRNESLLIQIQELQRKIALDSAGAGGANALRDPSAPNPPPTYVKGKIERVHPEDRRLVEISVGTDQGINKDHTLEVYRMSPKAEYLGMIRIKDATQHKAVGQLVRTGSSSRGALQIGDTVASTLSP